MCRSLDPNASLRVPTSFPVGNIPTVPSSSLSPRGSPDRPPAASQPASEYLADPLTTTYAIPLPTSSSFSTFGCPRGLSIPYLLVPTPTLSAEQRHDNLWEYLSHNWSDSGSGYVEGALVPIASAVGQTFRELLACHSTFPTPAHPATQRTLTSPGITQVSSWTDDTFSRDRTTTDLFPQLGKNELRQDWPEIDSISPIPRTMSPRPQLTFPDLELVEPWLDAEGEALKTVAGAPYEAEDATDGVEMDEDVDAEGSTEDDDDVDEQLDLELDFEVGVVSPVEDTEETIVMKAMHVEIGGGTTEAEEPTSPEVCSALDVAKNENVDQLSAQAEAPTTPAPDPLSATQDSAIDADALTAKSVAALNNTRVTPMVSINGSSVSSLTMSQDGSSLSSADGYGETDDEVEHDTTIDTSSSFAPSRSSSPASSIEVPLSVNRAGLLESAAPLYSTSSPAPAHAPAPRPPCPTLVAPSKSITKGRIRGPYQRSRPLVQPMDGIPAGSASFSEDVGVYTCTCHHRLYKRKGDLQRHLNEVHLPEVCDGCGRGFPRKDPRIR
ncbi:hypothetical protein FRB90_005054 [Tulasnella sp. 427]|nr:hypothetical protein FRB90_005054 [Tulasnella sp. 427]